MWIADGGSASTARKVCCSDCDSVDVLHPPDAKTTRRPSTKIRGGADPTPVFEVPQCETPWLHLVSCVGHHPAKHRALIPPPSSETAFPPLVPKGHGFRPNYKL